MLIHDPVAKSGDGPDVGIAPAVAYPDRATIFV
jgi:hypothetical protein